MFINQDVQFLVMLKTTKNWEIQNYKKQPYMKVLIFFLFNVEYYEHFPKINNVKN